MTSAVPVLPDDRPMLDWLGALAGAGCALHCTLVPLALAALPAIGAGWLGDERVGAAGTAISILLAARALTHGRRRHRSPQPLLLAALGFAALIGARTVPEASLLGEMVLSASGGMLVVAAHLINRSLCLTCGACRLADGENAGPCRAEDWRGHA